MIWASLPHLMNVTGIYALYFITLIEKDRTYIKMDSNVCQISRSKNNRPRGIADYDFQFASFIWHKGFLIRVK